MGGLETAAKRLAGVLGAGVLFRAIVKNTTDAEYAMAALQNVVKATGMAAGRSVEQLNSMSREMSRMSVFANDAVQGGLARLLTYTNIQGETFDRAAKAALNFAQAYRMDVVQAAETVGKALGSPEHAMGALSRQGYRFTESQQAAIKAMMKAGDVAGAQAIVLGELEVGLGNAAAAARKTLGGALQGLRNAFKETLTVSGNASSGIAGALNRITDALPGIRAKLDGFFTWWQTVAVQLSYIWQTSLLNIQEAWAKLLEKLSSAMQRSPFAWIRKEGAEMEATAHEMRDGIDQLRGAMENWRTEELAAIGATNQLTDALGGGGADSGLAGAIAMTDKQLKDATAQARRFADEVMRATGQVQQGIARAMENITLSTVGVGASSPFGDSDRIRAAEEARRRHQARAPRGMSPQAYEERLIKPVFAEPVKKLSTTMKAGLEGLKAATMQGLSMLTQALLLGGGGRGSQIGGALGGAFGGAAGGLSGMGIGGKWGAALGGPVGAVVGTMLGSVIGGLFGRKPKKVADGLDLMAASLNRVNEALRNVPSGYLVRRRQLEADREGDSDDPTIPKREIPVIPGPGDGGSKPPPSLVITGPVSVLANNPVQFIEELGRMAEREVSRGGVTRLALATGR